MTGVSRTARPVCLLLVSALCATATFVTNPGLLGSNASLSWSELGAPGSTIPQIFTGGPLSGLLISGLLAGNGTVGEVCPSLNCNFAGGPGFNPGDFLVWTENASGLASGPLALGFSSPLRGAGFYLELTAPASFTALFVAITTNGTVSESVKSDSAGDPVFLGILDPTADILSFAVGGVSCVPNSPGGCNISDFAVDTLFLTTTVPEPGTFVPLLLLFGVLFGLHRAGLLRQRRASMRSQCFAWLFALVLSGGCHRARAQTSIPYQPGDAQFSDGTLAVRDLPGPDPTLLNPQATTASLPVWNYQLVSPLDSGTYTGYMIGQNPFNRGARTTVIPAILIPVIITFNNTTSGFTATFDPSGTPDQGCTAGQTAMSLVENSPIFQSNDWTMNGVYVGSTQYIDAFQRANFWQYVQNTGDSYHTLLSYTEGDPLVFTVEYASPTLLAEVRVGVNGPCTNANGSGTTNGSGYEGYVNIGIVDAQLRQYIATHSITPDQLPIFVLYNVVMPNLDNPGFYTGGYHSSQATFPQILTSPGQTYVLADFQTNFFYTKPLLDTSLLSHEIGEWMNDPSGVNLTPAWGHVGQQSGCQSNLEVGDPLTGTNFPEIDGPNGFAYHIQELTFFSWFFRIPPTGAGGAFSSNGTFSSDAGPVCQ